jgi:hypothetical protein
MKRVGVYASMLGAPDCALNPRPGNCNAHVTEGVWDRNNPVLLQATLIQPEWNPKNPACRFCCAAINSKLNRTANKFECSQPCNHDPHRWNATAFARLQKLHSVKAALKLPTNPLRIS